MISLVEDISVVACLDDYAYIHLTCPNDQISFVVALYKFEKSSFEVT